MAVLVAGEGGDACDPNICTLDMPMNSSAVSAVSAQAGSMKEQGELAWHADNAAAHILTAHSTPLLPKNAHNQMLVPIVFMRQSICWLNDKFAPLLPDLRGRPYHSSRLVVLKLSLLCVTCPHVKFHRYAPSMA